MPSPMEIFLQDRRDKETMRAMSQGLRRNKDIAYLSMLSGDPTVGNFGGVLSGDVETRVGQRFKERENQAQRDLTQGYYDQVGAHQGKVLSEAIRHNKAMEEAAMLKNTLGRIKPPSDAAMKEAAELTSAVDNMARIREGFQDAFAKGDKGTGSMIPFEGDITNWVGRKGWGSEADQAQGNWWAMYQNLYELPQRNKMFGSALTESEKQAWKDANIDPNMPANVIRDRLATLSTVAFEAMQRVAEMQAQVYDPMWINQTYGKYFGAPTQGSDSSAPLTYKGMEYEVIE